jgi:N-acetylmuramoyl-L-alanine amidase
MSTYTIQQGDHLSSIAHAFGFSSPDTLWNHPSNAELKSTRKDPNILLPGDDLFIPDHTQKSVPGATAKRHKFRLHRPKLELRIVLEDLDETPLGDLPVSLEISGISKPFTTGGDGLLHAPLDPTDKRASIYFKEPTTNYEREIPIKIGHLDPIDTRSGQLARLNNLGYFLGDPANPAADDVQSAIEEFQCNHHLTVDGKCGPNTQAKLKKVHGC